MVSTSDATTANTNATRRTSRLRVACVRCQRRKIRCDAALPSCASCEKARTRCQYEGESRAHSVSKTYVADLEGRLKWLESLVKDRIPDIDLENGIVGGALRSEPCTTTNPTGLQDQIRPQQASTHITAGHGEQRLDQPGVEQSAPNVDEARPQDLGHQIGLVSLSAGLDPKYIGPSSGYFFAQLLHSARSGHGASTVADTASTAQRVDQELAAQLFWGTMAEWPSTEDLAQRTSTVYFNTLHCQFPFLHEATHRRLIRQVYSGDTASKVASFQVHMVLALGATMATRRTRVQLPAERWCVAAVEQFTKTNIDSSVEGLQSLLLLLLCALHSPASKLNAWQINYQCIAMVLDLGLQRNSRKASLTPAQHSLRRLIFWTVYSMDRTLSTMMGRPIGLRDEACDLQYPIELAEQNSGIVAGLVTSDDSFPFAIHLFKLAQLNSEMKYVLHSVQRSTPAYAYPAIRNIAEWQQDLAHRLDAWKASIPEGSQTSAYMSTLCVARFHSLRMLLFCPTPAIPVPTSAALEKCYKSAVGTIRSYHKLYLKDLLIHNWTLLHSVIFATTLLLYTANALPELARRLSIETWLDDFGAASNVLSAAGEHWTSARRSRELLDALAVKAVQRIVASKSDGSSNTPATKSFPELEAMSMGAERERIDESAQQIWDGFGDFDLDSFTRTFDISDLFGGTNDLDPVYSWDMNGDLNLT